MSEADRALREIAALALAEGQTDFAWVLAFLTGREDFAVGARFADADLARAPAAENVRQGLLALHERGLLEVWVERSGRPSMTWTVFTPKA